MSGGRKRAAMLIAAAAALAVALLALSGCGVTLEGASDEGDSGPVQKAASTGAQNANANLPARPSGVIRIEGKAQGSLTESLVDDYASSVLNVGIEVDDTDEGVAFDAFCSGDADIVDSARPISPAEYADCQENGIEPVQIQVASDAAVLAIENETDVGVDCLSVADVREIFRAASPVTNWSQVGYGQRYAVNPNAPTIRVAGPDAHSNVFGFFGNYVLGDPEPSPVLLRSDYEAFPSDRGVRLAVAGRSGERVRASQAKTSRQVAADLEDAVGDASQAVAVAEFQVEKGFEDGRPAEVQARDSERLVEAEGKLERLSGELDEASAEAEADAAAARRVAKRYGTLGLFRFSYYGLWEEELRPMEIEATSSESSPECIFPSQSTVTDASYPLSRQLLLTVSLSALDEAEINDFLSFAVAESQPAAIAHSLVPLPDEVRNTELAWLQGEMPPDVVYYPPSEVVQDQGDNG